jgi:tRNA-Thr(GGU) m(6)t(6)A37 methyltransferase TsaA
MPDIKQKSRPTEYSIHPIGYVRKDDQKAYIEIFECYRRGLKELQGFSHAHVLWWFHAFDTDEHRGTTQFDPPFEAPRLGVFASRAPMRPNPIGLSTVKIIRIDNEQGILEIPKIDAWEDTPVLDIKAYMPFYSRIKSCNVPDWAAGWPEWMSDDGIDIDEKPR